MRKHPLLWIMSLAILVLGLSACERPASVAPVPTEPKLNPTATSNPAQISIAQTQTAIASKPTSLPLTATPAVTEPIDATVEGTSAVEIIVTLTPVPEGTTAEPVVVNIPTLKVPVSYTLQEFETPYCIARRFNIDIGEFLSVNKLTTESKPEAGTILRIPGTGHRWSSGDRALLPHPASYTVKAGDTLAKIACLYGDVSPEAIIVVNGLKEPYTLTTGQVIQIP